jgi:hypothetical protein
MSFTVPPVVTPMIVSGVTTSLVQNTTYALPSKNVWVQSSATIQVSLDGSNWADVTASTTGVHVVAPFIRNTSSSTGIVIMVKILS